MKLCNSDEIIDKVKNKNLIMNKIVHKVIQNSKVVVPTKKISIITDDPDDNKILECAVAGVVHCIISNDKHLLNMKEYKSIQIITPNEFVEKYK